MKCETCGHDHEDDAARIMDLEAAIKSMLLNATMIAEATMEDREPKVARHLPSARLMLATV